MTSSTLKAPDLKRSRYPNRVYRYAIFPGPVVSKTDGDRHTITADQIIRSYGVPRNQCYIVRSTVDLLGMQDEIGDLIHLYPDPDGEYTIPLFTPNQERYIQDRLDQMDKDYIQDMRRLRSDQARLVRHFQRRQKIHWALHATWIFFLLSLLLWRF